MKAEEVRAEYIRSLQLLINEAEREISRMKFLEYPGLTICGAISSVQSMRNLLADGLDLEAKP